MGAIVAEALTLIAAHWDLVELVLKAAQTGSVDKADLVKAIEKVMTEASRLEMQREFPGEG